MYQFRSADLYTKSEVLLKALRGVDTSLFKQADIGGDQEGGFEQSFASLAYAYMQDKAPRLLDYLIGFQLLDRNDDNTKAAAVFGFKLDKQWVYAPVFFINGDLKGHELLYLKDQDAFVPLKENWVNYLLSRKPHVLGEGIPQQPQELGARMPDLRALAVPPLNGKFASAREWVLPYMPIAAAAQVKAAALLTKFDGLADRLDLRNALSQHPQLVKAAMDLTANSPQLKAAFDKFYGPDLFRDCLLAYKSANQVKQASVLGGRKVATTTYKSVVGKRAAADEPKVKIKVDNDEVFTQNLPAQEEEKEKLLRDGYLIEDHRDGDEVSVAYNTQVQMALVNPDETGLFDVLMRPGQFDRCLVISNPHSNRARHGFCTVIRLGDKKNWANADRQALWTREQESKEDFRDWFKGAGSDKPSVGGVYVAVTEGASGTVPFRIRKDLGDGLYEVSYAEGVDYRYRRPTYLPDHEDTKDCCDPCNYDVDLLQINTRAGTSFRSVHGTLYVPSEAKFVTVRKPKEKKDGEDTYVSSYLPNAGDSYEDDSPVIQPGNLADVQMAIMQKTAGLKIVVQGSEAIIDTKRYSTKQALFALVRDYGFREKTAEWMLNEATRLDGCRFRVKFANGYPMAPAMPEPTYGYDDYSGVQTINPMEDNRPVDGMSSAMTDPSIYSNAQPPEPDYQAMEMGQQASQTGQKDVFDTAMLGSLLKTVRQESIVDRFLGDLMKALDRLGRILFLFYYRNEEFIDRYGKSDAPELEDTIRNAFEMLGDLILFLKAKTVDPFAGLKGGEPEVSQSAAL